MVPVILTSPYDFLLCCPACDQGALFLAPINGDGYLSSNLFTYIFLPQLHSP